MAAQPNIAGLCTVAELTVVTVGVVCSVDNRVRSFIAAVVSTGHAVVHGRWRAGYTSIDRAGLFTVAELTIVAVSVGQTVHTDVTALVA